MYNQVSSNLPVLTKAYILSQVSALTIFRKYLELQIDPYVGFVSPSWVRSSLMMKSDTRVSATIYLNNDGVGFTFKDWGAGYRGDCFDIVKMKFGYNFNDALIRVANDFGLPYQGKKFNEIAKFQIEVIEDIKAKEYSEIRFRVREPNYNDKLYWESYRLQLKQLPKNIFFVNEVWLNGELHYIYRPHDPAYAYYFGSGKVKIYFPLRRKSKFLTNYSSHDFLEGFDYLDKFGEKLVITKSYKDVSFIMSLKIPSVSTSSESVLVSERLMLDVQSRFSTVFLLFDNDDQGIKMSKKYIETYPFLKQIFIPKNIAKDITDTSRKKGREFAKNILEELTV